MSSHDSPSVGHLPGARAPVTPRGRTAGETLPVEMLLEPYVESGAHGAILISGVRGSGRSTALAHLAGVFGERKGLLFLDGASSAEVEARAADALVVFASTARYGGELLARIELAGWGDDDAIEYLLGTCRARCASVMARVRADGERSSILRGSPQLWRIVLDEMAEDDAVPDVTTALQRRIDRLIPPGPERRRIASLALSRLLRPDDVPEDSGPGISRNESHPLLRHRATRLLLAAELVITRLCEGKRGHGLQATYPRDLLLQSASLARSQPAVPAALRTLLESHDRDAHPTGASLMLALDPAWRPGTSPLPRLTQASLPRARWNGLDLREADMVRADLQEAELQGSNLSKAVLRGANLRSARLAGAKLESAVANEADFSLADLRGARMRLIMIRRGTLQRANLTGAVLTSAFLVRANLGGALLIRAKLGKANLSGACLEEADLSSADFTGACADDCDFRSARLQGAVFRSASLQRSNFEDVELPDASFCAARLTGALFTDSVLPRADFRGARLAEAGLAGVSWIGANLRGADLTHASFHMGSSRSGLVDSPLASEGTRTGFYTDDALEQGFKSPEEIRKADLRGADLRGARVLDADFYLVDLRGAKYTPDQEEHFARTGAILHDRGR